MQSGRQQSLFLAAAAGCVDDDRCGNGLVSQFTGRTVGPAPAARAAARTGRARTDPCQRIVGRRARVCDIQTVDGYLPPQPLISTDDQMPDPVNGNMQCLR
jgi:hypothetical protein